MVLKSGAVYVYYSLEVVEQVQLRAFRLFFWGEYLASQDIPAFGNGYVAIGMGGQDEMHSVLVRSAK